jgi:hypothetical protein
VSRDEKSTTSTLRKVFRVVIADKEEKEVLVSRVHNMEQPLLHDCQKDRPIHNITPP